MDVGESIMLFVAMDVGMGSEGGGDLEEVFWEGDCWEGTYCYVV